jgi:HPt (histidine-containing phosphotransfer) domain-containing protein
MINKEAVLSNVGNDADLLAEIVQLFREESPTILDDIRSALERNDPSTVERAAHKLKGSLQAIAAQDAVPIALQLEVMGRRRDLSAAQPTFAQLSAEMQNLVRELDELTQGTLPS